MSTAIRALVPTKLASLNLLVAANECRRMSHYNNTSASVGRMTALQHFIVVGEEIGSSGVHVVVRMKRKDLLDVDLNDENFIN